MGITKYEIISSDIRKKIQNGTYPVNSQLPKEMDLCDTYEVSRITIKKAIDQLVYEGLIIKRRGSGTFVKGLSSENNQIHVSQMNGLFIDVNKAEIESKIILFEVILAGAEVADKLNIKEEDFVYHIIRYRCDRQDQQVIDYCYMPIDMIPGLKKEILQCSIYDYIEHTLNLRIQSAHRIIRAKRPNKYDQEYMNLQITDPVLSIEQIGYLDNGAPFEYSDQHHIGDEFEFKTVSIR